MNWLIRFAAALLPQHSRARFREQWLADLRDAPEVGLRESNIVVGALLFIVTVDRTAPELTGMPVSALGARLARWGVAWVASSVILAFFQLVQGGQLVASDLAAGSIGSWLLSAAMAVVSVAAIGSAAAAIIVLARAMVAVKASVARAALGTLLAGFLVGAFSVVGGFPYASAFILVAIALLLTSGVLALIAQSSAPRAHPQRPATPRARGWITIGGALVLLLLVAVGTLDLLVVNPLAKVPGMTLGSIYAAFGDAASGSIASVLIWTALWTGIAIALIIVPLTATELAARMNARRLATMVLAAIGAALFFKFFAGFSLGMDIGDAFALSGAEGSWLSRALAVLGTASLVAAVFTALAPRRLPSARERISVPT
ncbi:MAG: hypothetical protein ACOH1T_07855 [Microbacteriaceae bacterium]